MSSFLQHLVDPGVEESHEEKWDNSVDQKPGDILVPEHVGLIQPQHWLKVHPRCRFSSSHVRCLESPFTCGY